MSNVDKVLKTAKAEVGYLEKASNSNLDSKTGNAGSGNYTKYARDLDKVSGFYNGRKNGHAWCDVFVDWCFWQTFGTVDAKKLLCQPSKSLGAGCKYSMQYYEKKGQLYHDPKPGDQIFFADSDGDGIAHTGLVYKVDSSYVYTYEGNTSSASGVVANGGCVAEKKYKLSYARIAGYGRPNYSSVAGTGGSTVSNVTAVNTNSYQCYYKVIKGDTLWKLSKRFLGRGNRYPEIMALNNKKNSGIKIGEMLKIPKR